MKKFFKVVFYVIVSLALYGYARNGVMWLVSDVKGVTNSAVEVFSSDETTPEFTDTVLESNTLPATMEFVETK